MAVKFINQDYIENKKENEKKIKEFLEEQIEEIYNPNREVNRDTLTNGKINDIFNQIKELANKEETQLKKEITNINNNESINQELQTYLENAYKESIFEFRIVGLVIVDNKEIKQKFDLEKSKCENCVTKILFHATEIKYSSKILTSGFHIGKDNWYGIGIYFTDQFDYAKYYYKRGENFAFIPKLNDSFNIVVSEVYYDKEKLKQIFNNDLHKVLDDSPSEEQLLNEYKDYTVEKDGIHLVEVDGQNGLVINENKEVLYDEGLKKIPKDRFIGREYCITYKEQILPLYGLNFQRVDFCVIWRDSNFKNSSRWEEPLKKNRETISKMTGYNLYTESDTKEALKLVWRKRFNKIILISNVGKDLEGKKFVDKVRQILGFNVMVLFFTDDLKHLDWIKNYPNSLFCGDDDTIKNYIFNFNEEGINNIRENVKEFYGVELSKPENAFYYPLFEKYKDSDYIYSDLDCSEYENFE